MRRRTVVLTVLVVSIASLAGCGAFLGGSDGGPSPTPTPDVSGVSFPPGVNESGVRDGETLVETHRESLASSGFAYRFEHRLTERRARAGNVSRSTEINVTGRVRAASNLSAQRVRRVDGSTVTVSWFNGSAGASRVDSGNVSYESYDPDPTRRLATHYTLPRFVRNDGWRLVEFREDGEQFLFQLNVTAEREPAPPASERTVTISARMVVDDEGRIREIVGTINDTERGTLQGDPFTRSTVRRVTYELTGESVSSISRPEWLDAAREAGVLGG